MSTHIDVIATTISGSIQDWGKVKRIQSLFAQHGEEDVDLIAVDSHRKARDKARERVQGGSKVIISAGGSGTFNAILEGCYDAGVDLDDFMLGFLRKGSADLIGKTLCMPDAIEPAIQVFVDCIRNQRTETCDVLFVETEEGHALPRRFVGYGGAEIMGRIPYFTENRFMKFYKGILSQLFGDLGPFFVGTQLALLSKFFSELGRKKNQWDIQVDGHRAAHGAYQAMLLVNGDLGKDLPFARSVPLGSGDFHLFAFRDMGYLRLFRQLKKAWNASILEDPDRWGFEAFRIEKELVLRPDRGRPFPLNVDGSTMMCRKLARVTIADQIHLLSNKPKQV